MALPALSQYIPSQPMDEPVVDHSGDYWHWGNTFKHLDGAISIGTSGIGIDFATPVCEFVQIRAGFELMPHFKKKLTAELMVGDQKCNQYDKNGYRIETNYDKVRNMMYEKTGYDMADHLDMTGRITMYNAKFLVDVFPLPNNKKLHATIGFYWGPSEFASIESDEAFNGTIAAVNAYNKLYAAAEEGSDIKGYGRVGFLMGQLKDARTNSDGTTSKAGDNYLMTAAGKGKVSIPVKVSGFKPYIGVGYQSNLLKKRQDIKFAISAGLMFWGGTPSMRTSDDVNLAEDVSGLTGKTGDYVSLMTKLKAYPTIGFRLIKNIF